MKQSYFNIASSLWPTSANETISEKVAYSLNYSQCQWSGQINRKEQKQPFTAGVCPELTTTFHSL